MPRAAPKLRGAMHKDREAFIEMWKTFVDAKPSEPGNHDMAEVNWARINDPQHPLRCIIAVNDADDARGFTLFLDFPFTYSTKNVCYLLDIFVSPECRGRGYAGAMIEHLASIGRSSGWYKIFWMTEADNYRSQQLYDRVAKRMNYIRYDLEVSAP